MALSRGLTARPWTKYHQCYCCRFFHPRQNALPTMFGVGVLGEDYSIWTSFEMGGHVILLVEPHFPVPGVSLVEA